MKIIIGVQKGQICPQYYIDNEYKIVSINDNVKLLANKLIGKHEFSDDELEKIRLSGYKITSSFWVNLSILSCKEFDKVVVTDITELDNKRAFSKII